MNNLTKKSMIEFIKSNSECKNLNRMRKSALMVIYEALKEQEEIDKMKEDIERKKQEDMAEKQEDMALQKALYNIKYDLLQKESNSDSDSDSDCYDECFGWGFSSREENEDAQEYYMRQMMKD